MLTNKAISGLELFRMYSNRYTHVLIAFCIASISNGFWSLLRTFSWKYAARSTNRTIQHCPPLMVMFLLNGWSFFLLAAATFVNLSSRIAALRSRCASREFSLSDVIFGFFFAICLRVFSRLLGIFIFLLSKQYAECRSSMSCANNVV